MGGGGGGGGRGLGAPLLALFTGRKNNETQNQNSIPALT